MPHLIKIHKESELPRVLEKYKTVFVLAYASFNKAAQPALSSFRHLGNHQSTSSVAFVAVETDKIPGIAMSHQITGDLSCSAYVQGRKASVVVASDESIVRDLVGRYTTCTTDEPGEFSRARHERPDIKESSNHHRRKKPRRRRSGGHERPDTDSEEMEAIHNEPQLYRRRRRGSKGSKGSKPSRGPQRRSKSPSCQVM